MGSFRVKDAVSKRRPRQNIISLILKNAKKQGGAGGSTAGSSRCSASSDAGQSAAPGATGPSARGGRARKKTGRLLASAVELTKRTRRVTSGPSSARGGGRRGSRRGGALVRGQKCFYRSSRGISKVTVVGVHHDSKLEPYYTIRLRDGKEKQADGKHLTPVVQEEASVASVASAAAASKPAASEEDEEDVEEIVYEDEDDENDEEHATTIEEEGQGVLGHPLLDKGEASNASNASNASSAQPRPPSLNVTEATADHMTESSSEVEDGEADGDDRGGRPRHPRSPRPLRGGSNHDDDGNDGDMEESDAPPHGRRGSAADPDSAADADDSENARGSDGGGGGGRFYVDQDAYYRTEDGAVLKIRILAKPGSGGRYLVSLPDGSTESVRPERLATLMELSSQELARLMKEKNRRRGEGGGGGGGSANRDETDESGNEAPASRHHQRTHRGKRATRRGSGRRPTLDDGYMAGEDDGVGESSHESSSGRHGRGAQSKADDKANKKKAAAGGDGSPLLALSCPFRMVEAKTEEGGTKTVPLYDKGIDVYYKNFAGIQPAHILSNHLDDLLDPYYSIRLEDGREKQTDNAHIRLTAKDFETKEANLDEKARENDGADEGAIVPVGQKKRGSDASSSADATSASNKDASLTEYKKQYEALVMDGSDRGVDTTTSTLASSSVAASSSQALTPAPGRELAAPAHKYAVGDDVLYCSSQGESSTVAVTRLNLDKKGRPYYVVRLPGGKEKQVYGHRLKPLRIEPEAAEEGKGGRQRRSRSRSAAPSSRGRSRSLASGLRRSAPKRSDSVSSRTSNGSSQVSGGNRSSRGRRESAVRDPEPSATSDSRGGGRRRSSSRARGRSKSVAAGGRTSRSRSTAGRRDRSTSRPPEEGAGAERRPRAKRGAVGVSSSSRKVAEGGDGVGGGGSSRLSSIRKSFVGMSRSKH